MRAKGSCSVAASVGMTRVAAYQVGMLGTVINVLALRGVIAARGYRGMLMSPRGHSGISEVNSESRVRGIG